jgi:hypothetical protein
LESIQNKLFKDTETFEGEKEEIPKEAKDLPSYGSATGGPQTAEKGARG